MTKTKFKIKVIDMYLFLQIYKKLDESIIKVKIKKLSR
jgi:hypothetical protein